MGGLILRKFILTQGARREPIDKLIKQITFIASPHNGAVLAELGKHIPLFKSMQIEELSPRSGFVFELNQGWQKWAAENNHLCSIRSIFGTADEVVSPENARGLDSEAVPILGATHRNIVEPSSKDSEIVLTLERFLNEARFSSIPYEKTRHSHRS